MIYATIATDMVWGTPSDPQLIPQDLCGGLHMFGAISGLAHGTWTTLESRAWVGSWKSTSDQYGPPRCQLKDTATGETADWGEVLIVSSANAAAYSAFRVSGRAYLLDFTPQHFGTKHPMGIGLTVGELFNYQGGI
jgi:hypothetical protein